MNIVNALGFVQVLTLAASAARTADLDGTAIDILDYEGVGLFVLNSSAATAGTDPTLNGKLQHSDASGSGFEDVTGGAFAEVTDAASHQTLRLNVSDLKRYVKLVGDIGGTSSPAFTYGAAFVGVKKSDNT